MTRKTATVRREYSPGPYRDLDEIREANQATGHHWFSPDTMRGFGTRLGDGRVYGGRLFVSSDWTGFDHAGRAYTVRIALPDGSIDDVGGFLAFPTRAQAIGAAERTADATYEVRHDPYPGTEDREPSDTNYEWRVWAVPSTNRAEPLPIGTRNTKRAADKLALLPGQEPRQHRRARRRGRGSRRRPALAHAQRTNDARARVRARPRRRGRLPGASQTRAWCRG